jgi:hypothetical protein
MDRDIDDQLGLNAVGSTVELLWGFGVSICMETDFPKLMYSQCEIKKYCRDHGC